MGAGDTSLGGRGRAFPSTGGLGSRFAGLETQGYAECLDELAARYWKPVYTFIRVAWKKSNEDAKDLAQAFFAWLAEREALRQYAPDRGGFRTFLKVLLRRFLSHETVSAKRLKRGGGAASIPWEDGEEPLEEILADPSAPDPEAVFDQAWLATLMKAAAGRLRDRLAASGRDLQFRVFERHDLAGGAEAPSYADLARELGLKETQVRDHLVAAREEMRVELRAELARLTRDDAELNEEWRALFGP